ncbi:MAG TPA: TPM domain-containing protein, partial [Clostridiales bacterium]|nr:TPM domain-containing protein [Clostridiales bacterium]
MSRKTLKIIIFSFLLVILFPSVGFGKVTYPEPSTKFYVNDYANVIDEEAENLMVQNGNALEERTGAQIVLVTVNFTDGISIDEYAAELFNKWKLGSAEKNNGLLILLSIGDEDYWTVQGKGLEATLTSGDIGQILDDYLEPDFAVADYSEGAVKVYEAFIKELGGSWVGKTDSGNVGDSKNNGNTENYGNNGNS